MNYKHLFYIVPMVLLIGLLLGVSTAYSADKGLWDVFSHAVMYESQMDSSIILVEKHCMFQEMYSTNISNTEFCKDFEILVAKKYQPYYLIKKAWKE